MAPSNLIGLGFESLSPQLRTKWILGDGVGEESLFIWVTVVMDSSAFIQIIFFAFRKARSLALVCNSVCKAIIQLTLDFLCGKSTCQDVPR